MAALTHLFYEDWANLPDLVLTQVFSYLSEVERCRIGATCRHWLQYLDTSQHWRTFNCVFCLPADRKQVKCIEKYGHFISRLTIYINHTQEENTNNALAVLNHLSSLENVHLSYLSIVLTGEILMGDVIDNFNKGLQTLLTKIGQNKEKSTLKHLTVPYIIFMYNIDNLIDCISSACPNLEYLNISINPFPFYIWLNVVADRMKILVLNCRQIQVLCFPYSSLSDNVLKALSQAGRKPLQRLEIVCTRYDTIPLLYKAWSHNTSSEGWSSLVTAHPGLKVVLKFQFGCHCISEIMMPGIPVQELCLDVPSLDIPIYPEINKAVVYYEQMLEKLVVSCDPSRELQESILNAARRCKKLKALYVYCVLDKDVIDQILELCPLMRDTKDYILKWTNDPEP
ncbi:hypothetical protein BsWGS_16301 [Bradybaena similaris]